MFNKTFTHRPQIIVLSIWLACLVCPLSIDSYPAVVRPKPSATRSDKSRRALTATPFTAPDDAPPRPATPHPSAAPPRILSAADLLTDMIDHLLDDHADDHTLMLTFAGQAYITEPYVVHFHHPNGEVYVANFSMLTEFFDVDLKILSHVKNLFLDISPKATFNGDGDFKGALSAMIDSLAEVESVYVMEVSCHGQPRRDNSQADGPAGANPDDSLFGTQWQFRNPSNPAAHVNALRAWSLLRELGIELTPTKVAVLDDGLIMDHPDIVDALWVNTNEKVDGKDTDVNGCVDDIHGCHFGKVKASGVVGTSDKAHGTAVAGLLVAVANNALGIAGISPSSGVLELVPLNTDIYLRGTVEAVEYALANKIMITNNSYGFKFPVPTLRSALEEAMSSETLFMFAADNAVGGNMSDPSTPKYYNDYPARYKMPNVMCVGNVNKMGEISETSAVGWDIIDVGAPGSDLVSLSHAPHDYSWKSGTSMATPIVAGVVGLVSAAFPKLTGLQLKRVVLDSHRHLPALRGLMINSGIPDAALAIEFGACETAVMEALEICKPSTPIDENVNFWKKFIVDNSTAETLALKCQTACALRECISLQLPKLMSDHSWQSVARRCEAQYCQMLEGQCEDLRRKTAAIENVDLPNIPCNSCTARVARTPLELVGFIITLLGSDEAEAVASSLAASLRNVTSARAVTVDEFSMHGQKVRVVVRLDWLSPYPPALHDIKEALGHSCDEHGAFAKSEFGMRYCSPLGNCKVEFPVKNPCGYERSGTPLRAPCLSLRLFLLFISISFSYACISGD